MHFDFLDNINGSGDQEMDSRLECIQRNEERLDTHSGLLSKLQQRFYCIVKFDREMQIGGFEQFYASEMADRDTEIIEAMEYILAYNLANCIHEAKSVLKISNSSFSESHVDAIDRMSDVELKKWRTLSDAYSKNTFQLINHLFDFVMHHPDEFIH